MANRSELWCSVQLQFVLSYLITLCHRFYAKYSPRMSMCYHYGALEKNQQSRTWRRKGFLENPWASHTIAYLVPIKQLAKSEQ
jgi:hypothetical protein